MRKSSSDEEFTSYPPNAFKRDKLHEYHSSSAKSFQLKPLQKSHSSQLINIRSSHQDQHYNKYKTHDVNRNNDSVLQQNQMESDQSQNQQIEKQAEDIVNELRKRQQVNKANNKMVVGGGFSFDITEFFKFEKKKKLDSTDGDIFQQITGSVLAWIILLYSVVNSAMIPSWIMNIKATKLLRISWRFLMQSLMIFPFVLYERRVGNEEVKYQYSFKHIIKPVHLKKVYISSIATSIWFTCVLTVFEWTYVSHGLVLGSLSNFFLSIHRSLTKSEHDLQPGGRYCVILGILLVIYDSYALQPQKVDPFIRDVVNPFYLDRTWYQRVLADLAALVVSFTISKLSRYTSDMKSHYPPYLSMLLVNFFVALNMIFSTYFFNGLTFDADPRFGFFSLFSQQHFAGFLYMSIVLCFGMFVSFVLISKLFQDPILPALAMTLDPIIGTLLLEWSGIQYMPKAYSFIGYLFIVPGLLLILIGQCLYQRSKSKNNEQQYKKKTIQIIKELKQLKQVKSLQERKRRLQRVKTIRHDIDIERKEFNYNSVNKDVNDNTKVENNTTVSLNLPLLVDKEEEGNFSSGQIRSSQQGNNNEGNQHNHFK